MSPEAQRIAIGQSLGIYAHKCFGVRKRGLWYRPEARGYTSNADEAGRYTFQEAKAHECIRGEEDDVTVLPLDLPDFLRDLNAMHEAEKVLTWEPDNEDCQAQNYYEHLIFICGRVSPKGKAFGYVCHVCGEQIYDSEPTEHSESGLIHAQCPKADCYEWHLIRATAAQRAEAFLRTLNLWQDTPEKVEP